jgi:predicted ATPase
MIGGVTGGKKLPKEIADEIINRTDGVPLFIEELTKAVIESGVVSDVGHHYQVTGSLTPLAIPTSLQASLLARLDRLAPVREVAQVASALGRQFSHELISTIVPMPKQQLDDALEQFVAAELIFRRGTPPSAEYTFKHALLQDVAYQSLLRSKRHELHARIGRTLEEHFPEIAEARPELLAHHFAESKLAEPAIAYLQKAGAQAIDRSAYLEAISHLTKALELLPAIPSRPERIRRELDLRLALGTALMATRGYAGPEVGNTYLRARELCREIGDTPQLFPVLHGLYRFHHIGGDLQAAREVSDQLFELAKRAEDPGLFLEAHRALGVTLFWSGEVRSALDHLREGSRLYEPQQHRSHASIYGVDPGMVCLSYAALAFWYLGYSEQAIDQTRKALVLVQDFGHEASKAMALVFAAYLHLFRCEPSASLEKANAAVALCAEQGFPLWMSQGTVIRGGALVQSGHGEEGIAQICQGLAELRATGAGLFKSTFLALLADEYCRMGRAENGLRVLDEALEAMPRTQERFYEPELHRLRGELLLFSKPEGHLRPETCFRTALQTARDQSAKSLEIRTAISLARLWRDQGKRTEARDLLAPVYNWFTEGFDTPVLKEAKALLEQLSA